MNQRAWSEADLSAYLDGELDLQKQAALEADIVRDAALRRRVETLRQTIDLVRAVPLRESPRNYLLTPSMVAEPKQAQARQTRRRPMLFFMRLATALSAAAFVIVVGLQLGLRVGLVANVMSVDRQVESTQEVEAPMRLELEEADESPTMAAMPEETEMPAGEAPSWEELPSEEGEGMGRGGGVEEQPEASPVTEPEQPEEPEESVTLGADSVGTPTVESMSAPQEEETEIPMVEAAPTSSPSPEQVEEKLISEATP
ncbi:MAG: anti-sigma factor family protein, partial [Anaerolineae bacterium]